MSPRATRRRASRQPTPRTHEHRVEALHERFRSRLMHYLRSCGARPASCDDLVQDTFAVALTRFGALPEDDDEARLWLFAVARRLLANERRTRIRRRRLVDRAVPGVRLPAPIVLPDPSLRREALDAWRSLTDEERHLLRARAWEGLDNAALARDLGCSLSAAENRLSRARTRLQGYLV
jgi:RNA polymerase sigma-70 factor, ECF subfamily